MNTFAYNEQISNLKFIKMKKSIILSSFVMILTVVSLQLNAAVWRVNAAPGSSPHYTSLQAAHDAPTTMSGDTVYLEGSPFSTGGLTCTKKLIIIGSGYFLNQNPQTQANIITSNIDYYVYFNAGSAGSKIMGCYFTYPVYISDNNISIERNSFNYGNYMVYGYSSNLDNIRVIGNYFESPYYYNSIYFPYSCSNVLISNNYIGGSITTNSSFQGFIVNNVFAGYISINNATFTNNISTLDSYSATNCITTYNIGNGLQFGTLNGNQQNVDMSTVFVGPTGYSTDGQWQLKSGSPAIGAGEAGVDCGMFGGNYPYVLSGMPPIPAVYYFNAPSMPTNTINVSIKAKSHN